MHVHITCVYIYTLTYNIHDKLCGRIKRIVITKGHSLKSHSMAKEHPSYLNHYASAEVLFKAPRHTFKQERQLREHFCKLRNPLSV